MGFITRTLLLKYKSKRWYKNTFLPKISPITLITLLATIIIMCSYKANEVFHLPLEALKIAFVLTLYFIFMFFLTWFISKKNHLSYPKTCSLCFSASGNNFELAIIIYCYFWASLRTSFCKHYRPLSRSSYTYLTCKMGIRQKFKF